MSPKECPHNFRAEVVTNVVEDVNVISVDLKVECTGCGSRLAFIGMNNGLSYVAPTTTQSGLLAHLPALLITPDLLVETEAGGENP